MGANKKKMKKWLIWGVVVAALAAVTAMAFMPDPVAVSTARASKGTIKAYVEERARTTLPRTYLITMPVAGRIEAITLEAGETVAQGQLVAAMDTFDLDTALNMARAKVREIEARIAINMDNALEKTALVEINNVIGSMDDVSKAAKEVIKAGVAHREFTRFWLTANKDLLAQGAAAKVKYERARMDDAQAEVTVATDKLISSAVDAIKSATELGPRYISQWLARKVLERQVLEEQLAGAKAAVMKAENDRALAMMQSPVNGVVLKRFEENERYLDVGARLLEIGDLSTLEVTADILSQDGPRVKKGDAVEIYGEAVGTSAIMGRVKRIRPKGFTKVSSLGVEQQRVAVVVGMDQGELEKLGESGKALGVDFRVRVRIITDKVDEAIVVPRMTVFRGQDGGWRLFTVAKGKARLTPVEVGVMNDDFAQIVSGVSEGQVVIPAPPKTLADGDEVATAK